MPGAGSGRGQVPARSWVPQCMAEHDERSRLSMCDNAICVIILQSLPFGAMMQFALTPSGGPSLEMQCVSPCPWMSRGVAEFPTDCSDLLYFGWYNGSYAIVSEPCPDSGSINRPGSTWADVYIGYYSAAKRYRRCPPQEINAAEEVYLSQSVRCDTEPVYLSLPIMCHTEPGYLSQSVRCNTVLLSQCI